VAVTDLWTIEAPEGVGRDENERVWWDKKSAVLPVVAQERQANGCTCEAPPWFSPPGEWPMKVMLTHNPDCVLDPSSTPKTRAPTYEEALQEGRRLGLMPAQAERYARRVGREGMHPFAAKVHGVQDAIDAGVPPPTFGPPQPLSDLDVPR
jgi:hypothetical protein